MKKLSLLLVLALLIGTIYVPASAAEPAGAAVSVLHVSPDGKDSNPGSESAPLKTLDAAKRAANLEKAKGAKGVTVLFHGGEYLCNTKVQFTGEDSGTEDCPITYKAAGDGEVIFLGSTKVNIDDFTEVTDEDVLNRLPEASRDRVGQLDLSKYGITSKAIDMADRVRTNDDKLGTIQRIHNGIYLNGKRQPISRYPNVGFNHFGNVIKSGSKAAGGGIFEFTEPNPKKWINVKDAYLTGFFGTDYEGYTVLIDHVDQKDNYIYVAEGTRETIKSGFRWAAEHLIEEMDIPGEWYADKDKLILYYYPSHPLDPSVDTMRIATMEEPFIELSGVSYVNFEGLTFRENLSDGIIVSDSKNVNINNCTLAEIGAVGINIATGANDFNIVGCDIYNTGYQGVYLNYAGNVNILKHSNNSISNCHFYGNGRDSDVNIDGGIYFNSTCIGNEVKNNLFHNINNIAIRYYGMENTISNNEFFNCARAAGDTGLVYVGRTLNAFGNHVDRNYFHDFGKMVDDGGTYGVYGIYWDDWASGQSAEGNIIVPNNHRTTTGILTFGNYNTFRYNTIANIYRPASFSFRNGWKVGENATVMNSLNSVPPLPLEKYPGMMDTKNKIIENDGYITQDNVDISHNVAYNASQDYNINQHVYEDGGIGEDNRTFESPDIFVDPNNHDWRIKASAMEEYGLNENIPNEKNFSMDDIGFQPDVREIKKADDKFYKTYPQNGAGGVSLSDFGLAWEEAIFADEYHYTVATDYELTDVVAQGVTNETFVNIPNLEKGKIYYWTVKAKNLSKQIGNTWNSEGDVYAFSTKDYEEVYYYFLESAIEEAEKALLTIEEGTEIGSYSEGSRDILKAAIDKAKAERKTCKTQAEIDRAQAELRAVISTMGQYINLGYENLDASNINMWQQTIGDTDTVFKKNGDAVVLEGKSALMATRKPLSNYTIKRFRLKLTYDVGKEPGSTWAAISLRQADPTAYSWGGTVDYMIIIKSTLIELQKYYPTSGTAGIIEKCENNGIILENEWADIEFGALDVAGGVEIILNVDGKKVLDYYDDNLPIYAPGYMTVQPPLNDNGAGSIAIASPLDSRDGEKYIPPEELFKKNTDVIYNTKSSEVKKEGTWKEANLLSYDNTSTIEVSDDKSAKIVYTMSGKKEEPRRLYYWHTPMENGDKHAVLNLNIGDGSEQTIDFAREIDFTSGETGWVDLGAYPFESFTVDGEVVATLTSSSEGSIPAIVIKSVPATAEEVSFSKLFYKNGENTLMIQIGSDVYYDRLLRKQLDAPPVLINSTTMVPLRLIAEHFGGDVTWDAISKTARIVIDGKTVEITVDKDTANLDGNAVALAEKPVITNSRVMIPMRSVSEIFEKEVYWNDTYKFVLVGDKLLTGDFEAAAFTTAETLFNN